MLYEDLVNFTLKLHGMDKTKFKIIFLRPDQWKELSLERCHLDDLGCQLQEHIIQRREELKQEPNFGLKREFEQLWERMQSLNERMDKVIDKELSVEYGTKPKFEDYLNSFAIVFIGGKMLATLSGSPKKHYPLLDKFWKKGMNLTIFLNEDLLSKEKNPTIQTAVAVVHETLHYVEFSQGKRSKYESIQRCAFKTVREFLHKRK